MNKPSPPKYLTAASKKVWESIVADYAMDEPALEILAATLAATDRMQQARARINKDGVLQADRFGVLRAHPLIAVERDASGCALRGWRLLNFAAPAAEPKEDDE